MCNPASLLTDRTRAGSGRSISSTSVSSHPSAPARAGAVRGELERLQRELRAVNM